jgi:hypothetical protein
MSGSNMWGDVDHGKLDRIGHFLALVDGFTRNAPGISTIWISVV